MPQMLGLLGVEWLAFVVLLVVLSGVQHAAAWCSCVTVYTLLCHHAAAASLVFRGNAVNR